MSDDPAKRRLGRGLAALIGELDAPNKTVAPASGVSTAPKPHSAIEGIRSAPIEKIMRNPLNPRKTFAEVELEELSQSIKAHGIVQPVVVRPSKTDQGSFEIIAGERRWRAAQRAGLDVLPIVVRDVDDRLALEIAIIENVQRADLNPLEEAHGYHQLIEQYAYSQNDLAQVISKSRSHVANTLRLLKLPEQVQNMVETGALSAGHARSLITLENPLPLAERIVSQGLSVRETESLVQNYGQEGADQVKKSGSGKAQKDADTKALEKQLSDLLGLGVAIDHKARGGTLALRYKTIEQLEDICRRLGAHN